MRWVGLFVLCGCNQAFNLESTKLIDAPPQTAPVDAPPPPKCPPIGVVPRFSDDLRQIAPRNCEAYSISENQLAMGLCNGMLVRGDADAEMTQQITLDPAFASDRPRLAPEGDHLFLAHFDSTTSTTTFYDFVWSGTDFQKSAGYTAPHEASYAESFEISTPSRGPDRHIVYGDYNYAKSAWDLVEIADGGGTFGEVQRYPLSDLGTNVTVLGRPSLSPDGLRLVFIGSQQYAYGSGTGTGYTPLLGTGIAWPGGCGYTKAVVMYADRPTTKDKFSVATPLETVPDQVDWPYMTEDCGRIYLAALNRMFYFKQ
jgi:hypothetical protein